MDEADAKEPDAIEETTFVCTVPPALGRVTKLEVKNGRMIARTESGITMTVPQRKQG